MCSLSDRGTNLCSRPSMFDVWTRVLLWLPSNSNPSIPNCVATLRQYASVVCSMVNSTIASTSHSVVCRFAHYRSPLFLYDGVVVRFTRNRLGLNDAYRANVSYRRFFDRRLCVMTEHTGMWSSKISPPFAISS